MEGNKWHFAEVEFEVEVEVEQQAPKSSISTRGVIVWTEWLRNSARKRARLNLCKTDHRLVKVRPSWLWLFPEWQSQS